MATLPSLGQPSLWSTFPRNELKPSARTQVPWKPQIKRYSSFLFSFPDFEGKWMNLVFNNPVLHLSQSLLFFSAAKCDHRSHKVFKVFHMLQRVFLWYFGWWYFVIILRQNLLLYSGWWYFVIILRRNLWTWSPWHGAFLAWEVAEVLRHPV